MSKHTFKFKTTDLGFHESPTAQVKVWTDAESLDGVIDAFESYLKACGFQIQTGEIQFVPKEETK
jgi:hypothetical protein